ncbi:hypothetical protein M408DRAFT_138812 [Serendipita vermifera MAFF 305830]|uniref:Uncharacterized protein n=1 Tax=Serendipita vermifera MAFF 305830 TaxID=933852 RepID=A0A0C3A6U2_SERVB|nr:hypothetical protein M408DRAFT_138812 [Serendipita vermifera MAFF 305830]
MVRLRRPTQAHSSRSTTVSFQPPLFSYERSHQVLRLMNHSHAIPDNPGSPTSALPELDPPSSGEVSATPVLESSTVLNAGDYKMGVVPCQTPTRHRKKEHAGQRWTRTFQIASVTWE